MAYTAIVFLAGVAFGIGSAVVLLRYLSDKWR